MTATDIRARPATRSRSGRPLAGRIAVGLKYTSLVLAGVVMLVPLAAVLLTALKTEKEATTTGPLTPPENWFNLHNFAVAFTDGNMLTGFMNTGIILVFSITATVLIGSMAAFAVDRFAFRFKKLVLAALLVATLVPSVTTQVATYQIVDAFGLVDTRWGPILLYAGTDIVAVYIFLQFIHAIPVALDEAARMDGATSFGVYWRVILPLLKPAIATVVIIKGITVYNDFYIPFLYMPSEELGTVSTALFRFKGPFGAHWEAICAGAILVIVPTLVVFLFLQRFIYNGFASGATK